jgi:hypothetical protein
MGIARLVVADAAIRIRTEQKIAPGMAPRREGSSNKAERMIAHS